MMLKRALLVSTALGSAAVVLAACSPYTRDNPHDPITAPAATLSIVDATDASSGCSLAFGPTDVWPEVSVSFRARCLALDARGSSDTKNPGSPLSFTFGVYDTNQVLHMLTASDGVVFAGTNGSVAVLGPLLSTLPLRRPLRFAVTVENESGSVASSEGTLLLINDAPIALGDSPRTFPVGGFPWSPSASFSVPFRGAGSVDPDHDRTLEYCWTFSDSTTPVCSTDPADSSFVRSIPASPSRFVGSLTVGDDDPNLPLRPSYAEVRVRHPNLFVTRSAFEGEFFQKVDVTSAPVGPVSGFPIRVLPVDRDSAGLPPLVALIYTTNSVSTVLGTAPASGSGGTFSTSFPDLAGFTSAVSPDGSMLVVVAPGPVGAGYPPPPLGPASVRAVPIAADGSLGQYVETPLSADSAFPSAPRGVAVDAHGDIWAVMEEDYPLPVPQASLFVIPAGTGMATVLSTGGNLLYTAITTRPVLAGAPDEVWALRVPNANGVIAGDGSTISILDGANPTAPAAERAIRAGANPRALAWIDRHRVWIDLAGDSVVLLDADAFSAGASFDDSVITSFPDPGFEPPLAVDRATGTCLVGAPNPADGVFSLYRLAVDGRFRLDPYERSSPTGGSFVLQFDDADGIPWFTNSLSPTYLTRTEAPTAAGAGASHFLSGSHWALQDGSTGGLLVQRPFGIVRVAEDGSTLQSWSTFVDSAGAPVPIPDQLGSPTVSPDGMSLWGLFNSGVANSQPTVRWIDLRGSTARVRDGFSALYDPANDPSYHVPFGPIFVAGGPALGDAPFLWVKVDQRASPPETQLVGMVTTDGSFTSIFPLPSAEFETNQGQQIRAFKADLIQRDNDLCMANVFGTFSAPQYRVRRLSPAGTADEWATVDFNPSQTNFAIDTSGANDGSTDICWTMMSTTTGGTAGFVDVRAWTGAGTVLHSFIGTTPGFASSMTVTGRDQVWLSLASARVQIDFAAGSTTGGTLSMLPMAPLGGVFARTH